MSAILNLIRELVVKDLKIRYSRPALGFLWAFILPLLVTVAFYVVFGMILKIKTEEAPFFLYLMSAVFIWRFLQDAVTGAATSLVDNKSLFRESHLAHYLIPVSIVISHALSFLPSLIITILVSIFVLKGLPVFFLLLPVVLILYLCLSTGMAIIFSILYVRWRDTKYVLEAALLLLFYSTPAFYSLYLVRDSFPPFLFRIYALNPFVGILTFYRVSLLKGYYAAVSNEVGLLSLVIVPVAFTVIVIFLAYYLYRQNKHKINDYLSY